MGNAVNQVRAYVAEMLEATRSTISLFAALLRAGKDDTPGSRWVLERVLRTLHLHEEETAEHLERLGGSALLRALAPHPASAGTRGRTMAELYGALGTMHAGTAMLETNARSLGFSSTAALARRHSEELATMIARVRELLPAALKGEIVKERAL